MKSAYGYLGMLLLIFISGAAYCAPVSVPRIKVYIECPAFPTPVSASNIDFKDQFKAIYVKEQKIVEIVPDPSEADLEIRVTDTNFDSTRVKFYFTFVLHDPATHEASAPITLPLILPTALDQNNTKERLALNAGKGVKLLQDIISEKVIGSTIVTTYHNPSAQDDSAPEIPLTRAQKAETGPYFLQLSANGAGSQKGSGIYANTSGSGVAVYDFSILKSKYVIDANGAYVANYSSVPHTDSKSGLADGTFTTATSESMAVGESVIYTLNKNPTQCKGCWGIVVTNSTQRSVASNINFMNQTQLGMEWIMYPFKKLQTKELTIKAGPEFLVLNLAAPNNLGHLNEGYMGLFASIYYYQVIRKDKIIGTFNVSGDYNPQHSSYSVLNGTFNFTFQITDALSFSAGGGVSYSEQSISYPNNPNLSNSLQAQQLGGQAGLSPNGSIGINWSYGNRTQKGIDKR